MTGVEPNLEARSNCDPDIKSFVFTVEELKRFSKSSFDVITLWHVMEHIYNLEEQMDLICSLLKTEGKLVWRYLIIKVLIQNIIRIIGLPLMCRDILSF